MHGYAIALVLFSAILHATWNAQLKGGNDRPQFMTSMSLVVGLLALVCASIVPLPARSSWVCVALSAALHITYNLLLLQNYKMSDFASAYPIARGISPLLVTFGGFVLMHQRPNVFMIAGVMMISAGIVFLSTGKNRTHTFATLSALATGAIIAAYTVVDGMGVATLTEHDLLHGMGLRQLYVDADRSAAAEISSSCLDDTILTACHRGRCLLSGSLHACLVGHALRGCRYCLRASRDKRALGDRHRPRVPWRSLHLAQGRFGVIDLLRGASSGSDVKVARLLIRAKRSWIGDALQALRSLVGRREARQ
jgi:hypothetical protein